MAPKKLLNKVLKRFNSLLFIPPEEKAEKTRLIESATPEGLVELLNVFEQAFARQKTFLKAICESDPDFAKNFYVTMEKGLTASRTAKELNIAKKTIKQK